MKEIDFVFDFDCFPFILTVHPVLVIHSQFSQQHLLSCKAHSSTYGSLTLFLPTFISMTSFSVFFSQSLGFLCTIGFEKQRQGLYFTHIIVWVRASLVMQKCRNPRPLRLVTCPLPQKSSLIPSLFRLLHGSGCALDVGRGGAWLLQWCSTSAEVIQTCPECFHLILTGIFECHYLIYMRVMLLSHEIQFYVWGSLRTAKWNFGCNYCIRSVFLFSFFFL